MITHIVAVLTLTLIAIPNGNASAAGSIKVLAAPGPHGMTVRWYPRTPGTALVAHIARVAPGGTHANLPDVQHAVGKHDLVYEIGTVEMALAHGFATIDSTARSGARYRYDVTLSDGETGTSNLTPPAGSHPRADKMAIERISVTPEDRKIRIAVTPLQSGGYVNVYRSSGGSFRLVATVICQGHGATVYDDVVPAGAREDYRVAWMDMFGNVGPQSLPVGAIAKDLHHPLPVLDVHAQAHGSIVSLSWQRSEDRSVRSYDIYRAFANQNAKRIASVSAAQDAYDDRIPEGSVVRYDVRARTTAGVEGYPSSGASLLVPKTTPPDAPTGLRAKAVSAGVDLAWQPSRDPTITRYNVFRRDKIGAPFLLAQVPTSEHRYHVMLPAGSGAAFAYGVGAQDRFGNRTMPRTWATAHALRPMPASNAPIAVSVANGVAYVSVLPLVDPDVMGQALYRGSDGGAARKIATLSPKATRYEDPSVRAGHRYAYSLAAISRSGEAGVRSRAIGIAIAQSPPRAPALTARLLNDRMTVELHWPKASGSGIAGYSIVRRAPNGAIVTIAPLVRAFAYRDVLLPGTHGSYAYALRIVTNAGPSALGPFTSVRVP
jgi:hypothetical protein